MGSELDKENAVKIISNCASQYNKNLCNNTVLFVAESRGKLCFVETLFLSRHYQHLTGVLTNMGSDTFYKLALSRKLSPHLISFKEDGTTQLKLKVLPNLMSIHTTAKMIGDDDGSGRVFVADKYVGTITAALGLKKIKDYYVPQSSIKDSICNITAKTTRHRVVAIFEKPHKEALYKEITYHAKDFSLDTPAMMKLLNDKVKLPCKPRIE